MKKLSDPAVAAPPAATRFVEGAHRFPGCGVAAPANRDQLSAPARRDLSTRIAETIIFLLAIVGAVAIGLGSADLGLHPYVYAYLIAYAAFRIADLLVREESMLGPMRRTSRGA